MGICLHRLLYEDVDDIMSGFHTVPTRRHTVFQIPVNLLCNHFIMNNSVKKYRNARSFNYFV